MERAPTIIWVFASGTNVGKTTVAAALIRALNRRGVPTVGFKPYGGSLLMSVIDLMLETIPNSKCAYFGNDAWELSTASPLTGSQLVDTVAPVQFLFHPGYHSTLLARTGSVATGDVEYFRSAYAVSIQNRPDIVELAQKTGLPFADATVQEPLAFLTAPSLAPAKQQRAFEHLLGLGARTVVCEGAGPFLPGWLDCPGPHHAVFLDQGMVHLFPNLDARRAVTLGATVTRVDEFAQFLSSTRVERASVPLPVVESGRRQATVDQVVDDLIAHAPGMRV
jgi:hypothetical protein